MTKHRLIKVLTIILLSITLLFVVSHNNSCKALSDVTSENWAVWEPKVEDDSVLGNKINPIVGAIRIIGMIVSVGTLAVIGIKIMLGSVEEKANYKQVLRPWLIGATMVFAITLVPTIIYNFTINATGSGSGLVSESDGGTIEDYVRGYDAGIDFADQSTNMQTLEDRKIAIGKEYADVNGQISNQYYSGFYNALNNCINYGEKNMREHIINGVNKARTDIASGNITIDNFATKRFTATSTGEGGRIFLQFLVWTYNMNVENNAVGYTKGFDAGMKYVSAAYANYLSKTSLNYHWQESEGRIDEVMTSQNPSYISGFKFAYEKVLSLAENNIATYITSWRSQYESINIAEITPTNYLQFYNKYKETPTDINYQARLDRIKMQIAVWVAEGRLETRKNVLFAEGYDEGIAYAKQQLQTYGNTLGDEDEKQEFLSDMNHTSPGHNSYIEQEKINGYSSAIDKIKSVLTEAQNNELSYFIGGVESVTAKINSGEITSENYENVEIPGGTGKFWQEGFKARLFVQGLVWGKE